MRIPRLSLRRVAVVLAALALLGAPVAYKAARWWRHRHMFPPLPPPALTPQATRAIDPADVIEPVYDGALKEGWHDFGWTEKKLGDGAARVRFAKQGGWILAKPTLPTARSHTGSFGALVFRLKLPPGERDFLDVHVESASSNAFPHVRVTHDRALHLDGGWDEVQIPMTLLDPDDIAFDRIVLYAYRTIADAETELDKIGFTKGDPSLAARKLDPASYTASTSRPGVVRIRCEEKAIRISPQIYGIAYNFMEESAEQQWQMGATIRRWGGNPTSTYNWEKHVWNLGHDWFYENVSVSPYTKFLEANAKHGLESALTVPIMGWVAKDGTSSAFPVKEFGPQGKTDPWRNEAGDGTRGGKDIPPGPPTRTSEAITPDFVKRWVQAIRAADAKSGVRSVHQYILDNEPSIWQSTHRDLRGAAGYDEMLERTVQFGAAVREADPDAVIAGPAEWGWLGYFYSGKDTENEWSKADRKAHGDVPFIEWYLRKLREHEQQTGVRVLDVLDLHFYPQEDNVYGGGQGATDAKTSALRVRSTRSLWDPDYVDESWIREKIRLLPRMKEWVASNYPGRGISIGEWSFGGEGHPSGALATAEALGRFAQEGVTSAFYWTFPPADSPPMTAFLAFRNFDGKGGRFLDYFVPASADQDVSVFASRDADGKHLVIVAINPSPDMAVAATIDATSCGGPVSRRAFAYVRGARGLIAAPPASAASTMPQILPPYSITVLDVALGAPMRGAIAN